MWQKSWRFGMTGISWTICKQPAPHSRQITTPTRHHSIFTDRMLFLTPNRVKAQKASTHARAHAHTHAHTFNGPYSGTTRVSWYHKGKMNLDFTEARDSEWQWHQLGHMQVCTSLQTDNHASTTQFFTGGCPSCCPTNSVKALKA